MDQLPAICIQGIRRIALAAPHFIIEVTDVILVLSLLLSSDKKYFTPMPGFILF